MLPALLFTCESDFYYQQEKKSADCRCSSTKTATDKPLRINEVQGKVNGNFHLHLVQRGDSAHSRGLETQVNIDVNTALNMGEGKNLECSGAASAPITPPCFWLAYFQKSPTTESLKGLCD